MDALTAGFNWIESASEEVDRLTSQWKDVGYYESVFEEGTEDVEAKNEEISQKSSNILKNMVTAIKKLFEKIKEKIDMALNYFRADDKSISEYEEFLRKAKEDPEFAKKKISFNDFTKANNVYNAALKEAEDKYRSFKDEKDAEKPNVLEKFERDVEKAKNTLKTKLAKAAKIAGKAGGEVATSISVEAALKMAKSSAEGARSVKNFLKYDYIFVSQIEKALGNKELRKFKRKIRHLNAKMSFLNFITRGREGQVIGLEDSVKSVFVGLRGVTGKGNALTRAGEISTTTSRVLNRTKTAKKLVGKAGEEIAKDTATYVAGAVSGRHETKLDAKRAYQKNRNLNEADIKSEEKRVKEADKQARKDERREKKRQQKAARQSAKDNS